MPTIKSFAIYVVDIPLRLTFSHSAARRNASGSVFVKCVTDAGQVGFGESLPRPYVTGESRTHVVQVLSSRILPQLIGMKFESINEVKAFLQACDGKAPPEWLDPGTPQAAAWCAVDLALLDTFGRTFGKPICPMAPGILDHIQFSGVIPTGRISVGVLLAIVFRIAGLRHVKVKVGTAKDERTLRTIRTILGKDTEVRVDANMAWTLDQALVLMPRLTSICVRSFEQPLAADDLDGMAELVRRLGLDIIADESATDKRSLMHLIGTRACTSVNIRISKCGGLIAAYNRCQDVLQAGLGIQIGCQIGESSLLASAQTALLTQVHNVKYVEGCFGRLLLRQDVASPSLQFGYGGRPPMLPSGPGLGVTIDEARLLRFCTHTEQVR